MNRRAAYVVMILMLCPVFSFGEDWDWQDPIRFKHYNRESGLPGETVRAVYQDYIGNLWMGIESVGLCRFDGAGFKVYSHLPNDPKSISSDFVQAIVEDTAGNLWIGTDHGLNKLSLNQQFLFGEKRITMYLNDMRDKNSLSCNNINTLFVDSKGRVLAGTCDGLNFFDPQRESFTKIELLKDTKLNVYAIHEDDKRNLWVGTDKGLFKISAEGKVDHWSTITNPGLNHDRINALCKNDGLLWVGTQNGINIFNPKTEEFYKPDLPSTNEADRFRYAGINKILASDNGSIWISSFSYGILVYKSSERSFVHIGNDPENPYGLKSDQVRDLYRDQKGAIWIATKNGGLHLYDKRAETFGFITKSSKPGTGLNDRSVSAIYEDSFNQLWIGTKQGGLNRYSPETGEFTYYLHDPDRPLSLGNDRIECITEDETGTLWIGTVDGLDRYDRSKDEFNNFEFVPIKAIKSDRRGVLWLGTREGIYIFDKQNRQFLPFGRDRGDLPLDDPVTAILEDTRGNIWFGMRNNGLVIYDPFTESLRWLKSEKNKKGSLTDNMIRSIYEDREGRIWVGTKLNGLNLYVRNEDSFRYFGREEGLNANSVFSILEGNDGNLWLATNNGISSFNYKDEKFENYTEEYGLQGDVFINGSAYKANDGTLFFGGNDGLNYFKPSQIEKSNRESKVLITSVKIYDEIIGKEVLLGDRVLFNHDDYLSFEFVLLDYGSPKKSQYAYRLLGFKDQWVFSGIRNFVSFINLAPGEYQFQVKGANLDGVWNDSPATFSFTILPPWYLTWQAIILYSIFGLAILFLSIKLIRYRSEKRRELQMLRIQKEHAEKVNQFKLRFFTNVSHELRTPLTLIIPPSQRLMEMRELPEEAKFHLDLINKNSRRLERLINELLEFRKIENDNYQLKLIRADIIHFIQEITRNFTDLAEVKNIKFNIRSHEAAIECFFDPNALEKIISNLLSNAFKFTRKNGRIDVTLKIEYEFTTRGIFILPNYYRRKEKFLYISVKDNGIGISRDELDHIFERFYRIQNGSQQSRGTGIGLDLVKNLVDLHHGKIQVFSQPNEGSEFLLKIPLEESYYKRDIISVYPLKPEDYIIDFKSIYSYDTVSEKTVTKEDQSKKDKRILVIEDDNEVRDLIARLLSENYEVIKAASGKEGLKLVNRSFPDIIICDVMMPDLSGFDFCKSIKVNFKTSHIPVILLTAKAGMESKLASLEKGADAFIEKPFHPNHLNAEILNLLNNREILKNHFKRSLSMRPRDLEIPSMDENFIKHCIKVIEKNIDDVSFSVLEFSKEVGLSRTQLFRKLKSLLGQTPTEFMYSIRLKRAAQLLSDRQLSISEVAYMTGFSNPSSFSTSFRKHFGKSPKMYIEEVEKPS